MGVAAWPCLGVAVLCSRVTQVHMSSGWMARGPRHVSTDNTTSGPDTWDQPTLGRSTLQYFNHKFPQAILNSISPIPLQ